MEKEYKNLVEEEYVLKRDRNYSDLELNRKTAEDRRIILELLKVDKDVERNAAKQEQQSLPRASH